MNFENILKRANLKEENVISCFSYGSRVYGNFRKDSDYDFIIVVKNKTEEQFSDNLININFFSVEEHQNRLNEHEISALECYFLPGEFVLKNEKIYNFKLDLQKLRHALSAKSSNSFVKSKKKLTVEIDKGVEKNPEDVGKKSLFHAFRIIDFGMQIAIHGEIKDYSSSNALFKEIMYSYSDWNNLFENYKQKYNNICTDFRKLAPK
jgi:predicted nucleotidyltransferase